MKLGNLYNLKSMRRFQDSGKARGFTDAAAGVVLARQLEYIDPNVFRKLYPELSFMTSGVTVDNSGGYSRRIRSLRIREQGNFTTAGDSSGNKGKISIAGEDSFLNVLVREAMSQWDDDEVKEAELGNRNLVTEFVSAHNKQYQREVDEIGYLGIPDVTASTGLLNHAGFTATSAGGLISTLTPQEMYSVFADLINAQHNDVNNTPGYAGDHLDMPVRVYNELARTLLDTAGGISGYNVLEALKRNFPGVQFRSTFRAEDVGGTSASVIYSGSEEVMKMRVPVPLTLGEIIKVSSFDYRVDSKYRIAGLDILEDAGGRILTGL